MKGRSEVERASVVMELLDLARRRDRKGFKFCISMISGRGKSN
jgi:hypothetical protein